MSAASRTPPDEGGASAPVRGGRRIAGIDVARAVAIFGMVMVHFTLADPTGAGGQVAGLPEGPRGRAALLFVLVAGVGVSLLDRGRSPSRTRTRQRLLWRSVVLLPLGLALQELGHGVSVILADFAVLFVVAAVAVGWSRRALLAAAAAAFVAGPAVFVAVATARPDVITGVAPALTDPPAQILTGLLVGGVYPLVAQVGALLLGMWLGRLDLADPRVQARALAAGAVVALLALWAGVVLNAVTPDHAPDWWALAIDDEPHSQSFVWLWQAGAAAVATLAACLVVAEMLPRLLRPLVALGQFAFTVYVVHILAMAADPRAVRAADVAGAGVRVVAFMAAATLVATAWLAFFRRGPLEYLLDAPFVLGSRGRASGVRPREATPEAADRPAARERDAQHQP
ncbi:MAG TPA: acyltransferase family protein [Egibacteraceae bacterium]|nr:acyltransferase family protein [Egibacteraceae bacterium]